MQTERNIWIKGLVLFLALALIISSIPSQVYAIAGEALWQSIATVAHSAQDEFNKNYGIYEVTARREENVKHFSTGDGSVIAVMYTSPVHTLDANGNWQDIDNRLADSGSAFSTSNARIKFAKKITGNEALFTLHDGNRKITMSLNGAIKKTPGVVTNHTTEFDSDATQLQKLMTLDNLSSEILYADILDGVDLQYVIESLNVKENIIVKKQKESYQYTFTIALNNLEAALCEDGAVQIYDPDTMETVYNIPTGFMYDANGEYSTAVTYTLVRSGNGKYTLTVTADSEWINADERAFPVVIDPTLEVEATDENGAQNYTATSIHPWMPDDSATGYPYLAAGTYGIAYWKANQLPEIQAELTIIKAGFLIEAHDDMRFYPNSSYTMELGAFKVLTDWDETLTYNEHIENNAGSYSEYANDSQRGTKSTNRYDLDITEYVKEWYNNPGTNYGIAITAVKDYQNNGWDRLFRFTYGYNGSAMYIVYTDGYSNGGVEDYWSYSTQTAGAAGTGYVNNATGKLTFAISTFSTTDSLFSFMPTLVYNGTYAGEYYTNSTSEEIVHLHAMAGYGFMLNVQQTIYKSEYINADNLVLDCYIWTDSDGTKHCFYPVNSECTEFEDGDGLQLKLIVGDESYTIEDQNHYVYTFTREYLDYEVIEEGGFLQYITDPSGNKLNFVRDSYERVIAIQVIPVESSAITFLTLQYNSAGMISSIVNTYANQRISFYYSQEANSGTVSTSNTGYLKKAVYLSENKVVSTTEYSYDDAGKLICATEVNSGYSVNYSYDGQRVCAVEEKANNVNGQKITFAYRQQYTEIRTSGADDVHGTNDDIISAYIFDEKDRVVCCYTMDITRTTIYGATSGEYETQSNIKNNIKTAATVGGTASNYLFNGGFEHLDTTNMPLGWIVGGGYIVDGSAPIYDNNSIAFNLNSNASCYLSQAVMLAAGEYALSADVDSILAENVSAYLQVWSRTNEDAVYQQEIPLSLLPNSNGAVNVSLNFSVSEASAGIFDIAIVISGGAISSGAEITVDNIMLEKNIGQSGYSMVEYGNFESVTINNAGMLSDFYWNGEDLSIVYDEVLQSNVLVIDQSVDDAEQLSSASQSSGFNWADPPIMPDIIQATQTIYQATAENIAAFDRDATYTGQSKTFVVSGMAKGTYQTVSGDFCIELYVRYMDWSSERFQVNFYYGSNEWQFATGSFKTKDDRPIKSVDVRLIYQDNPGVASFDNIYVTQIVDETISSTEYYPNGKPKSQENGYYQEAYEYDDDGNVIKIINNRGELFEYTYENYCLISEKYSLYTWPAEEPTYITEVQHETVYAYNIYGLLESTITYQGGKEAAANNRNVANRVVSYNEYDLVAGSKTFGALIKTTDNLGIETQYLYNELNGRLEAVVNLDSRVGTVYYYDDVGNISSVYPATVSISGFVTKVSDSANVSYTYDAANRLESITTTSSVYTFQYDDFGKTTDVSVGESELASYTYNPNNGKLASLTYGNGFTVSYCYDTLENISQVLYNGVVAYLYYYNSYGQLYRFENRLTGKSIVYQYDINKRLTSYMEYSTADAAQEFYATILYDDKSRVSQTKYGITYTRSTGVFSSEILYEFGYTDEGAVASYSLSVGPTTGTITYAYDDFDRLTEKVIRGTTRDEHGSFVNTVNYEFSSAQFREDGQTVMGTSVQVSKYTSTVGTTSTEYSFEYDDNGNITRIQTGGNEIIYHYDDLNQLIQEDNGLLGFSFFYHYDNAGNITKKETYLLISDSSSVTTLIDTQIYAYGNENWGDQLTSYNGIPLIYDAIGNPVSYYNNTAWRFTWQNGRQLATATGNDCTLSFTYNDGGIRTSKTVNGVEHTYRLNGSQIVSEEWAVGSTQHVIIYVYDAEGTPIGMQYRNSTYPADLFGAYWFEKNLQGDIVAVYDAEGTKLVSYTYDAWGNFKTTYHNGSTAASAANYNPFRYRGYYYDSELGMYYLQSRYYDPAIGRFINVDNQIPSVSGDTLGYNLFAYCMNNPVNMSDPTGHWPKWATIALGAVAAVAAVAVTVATLGAAAPAAACTLTLMGMSMGASYAVASTVATVAVVATTAVAAAYAGDIAYSAVTGDSLLLDTVFQGNSDAYSAGLTLVSLATAGMLDAAAQSPGVCFVAGTMVLASGGYVAIETIEAGDYVWASNPETGEVAMKQVVQTFVNEATELVHVIVEGKEIICTTEHPFYSPMKGWIAACNLRAGDILVTVNGEHVIVEKVQLEILEIPIMVYNFEVADFHTYYVSNMAILVHNMCAKKRDIQQIENAAREGGIPDNLRRAFGDFVEDTKWGLPKDFTYSYQELLKLAEEFKELFP